MKKNLLLSAGLVVCATAPLMAVSSPDLPKAQSFSRYEAMMNKSPFAVATAAVPAQTASFAKDLYIANAARLPDEGVVTLASSTDKNLKEYLTTLAPNKSGYSISNIEWSDRIGATKVTIAKDGQFATLTFNQALLSQPVATAAAQPQPQPVQQVPPAPAGGVTPPIIPYGNTNTIKPAPIPTLPTPPPRVRGVIQRNPAGAPLQPAQQQAQHLPDD